MSAADFTFNRELLLINVTNKLLAWQSIVLNAEGVV
jgi:hypothetical protein